MSRSQTPSVSGHPGGAPSTVFGEGRLYPSFDRFAPHASYPAGKVLAYGARPLFRQHFSLNALRIHRKFIAVHFNTDSGLGKDRIVRMLNSCMRVLRPSWAKLFCHRRRHISQYLIGIGAAAALMASCAGGSAYNAAAQTNTATDDDALTVEKCLSEANGSVTSVGQSLTTEGIIGEELLSTPVTNGMCRNMLERASDGTAFESLIAAQNYIQEIKLIENAMSQAAGETAAKKSDRYLFGDESLVSARVFAQSDAAEQYPEDEADPENGGGEEPVEPEMEDEAAATVAGISEKIAAEPDLSVAKKVEKLEARLLEEGRSRSEAAAGARCGLENAFLEAVSKELSQRKLVKISPDPIPTEMEYGKILTVELSVSGAVVGESYEKLERQYEKIEDASKATDGCVNFTKRMAAKLFPDRFDVDPPEGFNLRPIIRDTTWRWDIKANRESIENKENTVHWLLGHELRQAQIKAKPRWIEPQPPAIITVKVTRLHALSSFVGRNWQWLLPVGVALAIGATWLVRVLAKREGHPSEPGDGGSV